MSEYELPDKYVEAEEWARHFLKRMAALRRTSMDLSKALVKIRKPI